MNKLTITIEISAENKISIKTCGDCQTCSCKKKETAIEDSPLIKNESQKSHEEFFNRIRTYLCKKVQSGESTVTVRKIQNSFSPEYPSATRVLEALDDLGYFWIETDEGIVVDLTD